MNTTAVCSFAEPWNKSKFIGPKLPLKIKVTLIYSHTKNIRAVQLLLGRTKIESTVRYLGIEVDDALAMAEKLKFN
jgi:hypothetical protein